MKKNNNFLIIILGLMTVILAGLISLKIITTRQDEWSVRDEPRQEKTKDKGPVITKVYFVGDMMLARGVESSVNKNFGGDFSELFKNVPELKEADILFGNLEGPISENGNNVGSKYSFRFNKAVLPALKEAGFNVLSFANNHIGDWNVKAFNDTLINLKDYNILFTGAGENKALAETPAIIEKNGIRFGFIGFSDVGPNWMEATEERSGILLASDPNYSSIISRAKEDCDFLIVSIHFGEEYKPVHNERQEKLAHLAIDAGADIIIGHHPHVEQDIEIYEGKTIIYSLGNFIFDQHFSKETMRGMIYMLTFEDKELSEAKKMTSILNKKYQPEGLFEDEEIKDKEEIVHSSCPKPDKDYENLMFLALDQENGLPDINYTPRDLVSLGEISTRKDICLVQEVKKSLTLMFESAKEVGLSIKVTSAFRDYNYQENLYKNALKNNPDPKKSVAKPGYSEHQLGTTADLSGSSINFASASINFDNTPEDLWLRENAYLYGFIKSFPYGKDGITGYKYEPWHYRYVGKDVAKKIKNSGLTLVEYLRLKNLP